jgi:hypothetical protein
MAKIDYASVRKKSLERIVLDVIVKIVHTIFAGAKIYDNY